MEQPQQQQQQAKRRRRSSVRLGEIGFAAPYDASSLWIEPARQRRKSASASVSAPADMLSPGAKAPRIRPLEQLAREAAAAVEEDWSVVELADGSLAKGRKVLHPNVRGKGARWRSKGAGTRPKTGAEEDDDGDDEGKEILASQAEFEVAVASTSSDSEELLGNDLKGEEEEVPADDSGNGGGSDGSGAKPHSHGDEMQGAIEDGPRRVNGKVLMRSGKRRSGKQASIRDLASRDAAVGDSGNRAVASRDAAGEPTGRAAVANGATTVVTPSSSQRGLLSAGVGGWLLELGLGKYSELFERNEVDTEVLPLLTFEDLREMGVDAVGARRKMFNGIQELGQIRGI